MKLYLLILLELGEKRAKTGLSWSEYKNWQMEAIVSGSFHTVVSSDLLFPIFKECFTLPPTAKQSHLGTYATKKYSLKTEYYFRLLEYRVQLARENSQQAR